MEKKGPLAFYFVFLTALVGFNSTEDLYDLVKSDILDELMNYNYTALPYRYTTSYIQRYVAS